MAPTFPPIIGRDPRGIAKQQGLKLLKARDGYVLQRAPSTLEERATPQGHTLGASLYRVQPSFGDLVDRITVWG
jgi:hypothetical protein